VLVAKGRQFLAKVRDRVLQLRLRVRGVEARDSAYVSVVGDRLYFVPPSAETAATRPTSAGGFR
jgi:hypothetical protein